MWGAMLLTGFHALRQLHWKHSWTHISYGIVGYFKLLHLKIVTLCTISIFHFDLCQKLPELKQYFVAFLLAFLP